MMNKHFYIDIHAIQTLPPSCVNRDDTGSPKTAVYGGVERARVSSQAWKRAMREYFKDIFAPEKLGSRTKRIPELLAAKIAMLSPEMTAEKADEAALNVLKTVGIKVEEKSGQNAALFFISEQQLEKLAELAAAGGTDKNAYKEAMKEHPSFDIVLFGRMVADDPDLNYDAASQVAHAISTHAVHTEYDYFTAVDDGQKEDESGAGHLGTVEFNSATMYRYATLNVAELKEHLSDDTAAVVRGFVEAFVRSMPTGKQNTFANRTLPDLVYVTVRGDQPVNLSGAFECAVKNEKDGYVTKSCKALLTYADKVCSAFADAPLLALGCGDADILDGHAEALPFRELLDRLETYTAEHCDEVTK